jgi:DNA polymerase V
MGFPVPGDAFEQSIDLNCQVIANPAATFFMRVEREVQPTHEVHSGDLLVVDRSLTAQDQSLVVAAIEGQLQVLRVRRHRGQLIPPLPEWDEEYFFPEMTIWGVVTTIIRKV